MSIEEHYPREGGILLRAGFSSAYAERWKANLTASFKTLDRFATFGGLTARREEVFRRAELQWHETSFQCRLPSDHLELESLPLLLRVLSALRVEGSGISDLTLVRSVLDHQISKAIEQLDTLQPRERATPFELEICPLGSWLNIEAYLVDRATDEIAKRANDQLRAWIDLANLGAFQFMPNTDDPFGVSAGDAAVGDDFLQWNCVMSDVPPASLNSLINMFTLFSREVQPVRSLYIG